MIWLILLFSTITRLVMLDQSLWLDEAITAIAIQKYSLVDLIINFSMGDLHPPGHYVFLWFWSQLFGYSEISLRLPSVIFGVATVWLVYLIGKELISRRVGLIAALLLTFNPLHVYYSQEARMYSLTAFVVTLSFYYLTKLLFRVDRLAIFKYASSCLCILYLDYIAFFVFPAQLLIIFLYNRNVVKKFVQIWIVLLMLFVPWLVILSKQLTVGLQTFNNLENWAKIVGGASVRDLALIFVKFLIGRISFENKIFYGVVVSIPSAVHFYLGYLALKTEKKAMIFLIWFIVPIILVFLVSFFIPVLSYFRLLYILPSFVILLAIGLVNSKRAIFKLTFYCLIMFSIFCLVIFYINPNFQREDWRGAVKEISSKINENSIILFENSGTPAPYEYYSKDLTLAIPGLLRLPASSTKDVINVSNTLQNKTTVYLFEYLVDITDYQRLLEKKLIEGGFKKVNTTDFHGVGFVHQYDKD